MKAPALKRVGEASAAGFRREMQPLAVEVDAAGVIVISAPGTSLDPQVRDDSVTISPEQVDLLIRWLREARKAAVR